jgi:hypothetical protein
MKTACCRPQNGIGIITHACIDEKSISPQWLINASATTPENRLVMVLAHASREAIMFRLRQISLWNWLLQCVAALRAWAMRPARVKPFRINRFH